MTVDAAGERSLTYDRSASPFRGALDADDILPDGSEVDVLCFSGIAIAMLRPRDADALAYATAMHERGGTVVYDPTIGPLVGGRGRARGPNASCRPSPSGVDPKMDAG